MFLCFAFGVCVVWDLFWGVGLKCLEVKVFVFSIIVYIVFNFWCCFEVLWCFGVFLGGFAPLCLV